jgi:lipopolysaccharide/colanic/teichoic acid biosynthesis glycosyltransferase
MVVVDVSPPAAQEIAPHQSFYLHCKLVVEWGLAALLFVLSLPMLLALGLLVRLTSRGPALYRQRRVGRNGRIFTLYKLRTMVQDAEVDTGAVWSQPGDPRVTRFGRFLRHTHLDEFPQLLNVLKGEMALVGPRPERPEFVARLAREIPDYLQRLSVRPGITGLAQIFLPPDTDVESVRVKLAYDLEYLRLLSAPLDLKLLACTGFRLLKFPHLLSHRMVGLNRHVSRAMGARPLLSHSPDVQD